MTVETKLPFEQEYIRSFSTEMGEPLGLQSFVFKHLQKLENLPMPRPDKTKIDKWNFTQFRTAYCRK